MREILFRGKKKPWGGWAEGSLVKMRDYYRISEKNDMISFGVETETIGQFTGLTDKNGTKIFEGDIVEAVLTNGTHYGFSWGRKVVVFDRGAFCLKDWRDEITPMCNYSANVDFEVLGNIHDNPELLRSE